jgi:hypothetical protein
MPLLCAICDPIEATLDDAGMDHSGACIAHSILPSLLADT